MGKFLMQVLWPSFLMAIVAEGLFFSLIDPRDLLIHGIHVPDDRMTVYTVGFFFFWLLLAASSALTWLLEQKKLVENEGSPTQTVSGSHDPHLLA